MVSKLGKAKKATLKRLSSKIVPSQIPHIQHTAAMAVGLEAEQADALNEAVSAAGLDYIVQHNAENRQRMILGVADAISNQNFRGWWWENVAPSLLDNSEQASNYAGLDADEWRETITAWHRDAYENGLVEQPPEDADPSDLGETATRTVEARFGVTLPEFVDHVVNWDRARELRRTIAGPWDQHTRVIEDLTRVIERQNERIEELEQA